MLAPCPCAHSCSRHLQTPHLTAWVNYLKGALTTVILYSAFLQLVLVYIPHPSKAVRDDLTMALFAGLAPMFVLGGAGTWAWMRYFTKSVLTAFA